MKLKLFVTALLISSYSFSFAQANERACSEIKFPRVNVNKKLSYEITTVSNNTYCYNIFNNGSKLIEQRSIPCLPGNVGFKSKKDAEAVAQLVIHKIQNGEMPPSVTTTELKNLNVISQ